MLDFPFKNRVYRICTRIVSGMSQQVTYRLPEEAIADIRSLACLMQTSPARVIPPWISAIAHAVATKAGTRERGAMTGQWGGPF